MKETKKIDPNKVDNNKDKTGKAVNVAVAVAAGAAGAAGATLINGQPLEAEEISEINTADSGAPTDVVEEVAEVATSGNTEAVEITESAPEPEALQPITDDITNGPGQAQANPSSGNPGNNNAEVQPEPVEPVNPNEIAEAIIAEDQIDPNDIDMADVIDFDEIGTVYTIDGDSYTAAAFHDAAGNDFVMVDIDGDDVFDIVTDQMGNLVAEVPGCITVDDAEIGIIDDPTYMAHNEHESTDEFGSDTISQDLIS